MTAGPPETTLIRLSAAAAGDTAQFLMGLAALVDPDDPDGLPKTVVRMSVMRCC